MTDIATYPPFKQPEVCPKCDGVEFDRCYDSAAETMDWICGACAWKTTTRCLDYKEPTP